MTTFRTIHDVIADLREEEERQRAAAFAAIKEIHAQPPTLVVAESVEEWNAMRSRKNISRGPGAIAKFSSGGKFLGWYRNGQRSGLPSKRMPMEVDLDAVFEAYAKALRNTAPKSITASILGKRSARSRQEKSLVEQILTGYLALCREGGVPKHHRPKRLAAALDCDVEYVRRVLRKHRLPLQRRLAQ